MSTIPPSIRRTRPGRPVRSSSVEFPVERPCAAIYGAGSPLLPIAQLAGFLWLAAIAGVRAAMHPGSFLSVLLAGIAFMLILPGFEVAGRSNGVSEDF